MNQSLKIIHELARSRLENKGQCISCKFSKPPKDYFDTWDCTHELIEKLPETTGKKGWGEKGCPCPLWEPRNYSYCDKHGFFLEDNGCGDCEYEYYKSIEIKEKNYYDER